MSTIITAPETPYITDQNDRSLLHVLDKIFKHKTLIISLTLLGIVLGGLISTRQDPNYTAQAIIQLPVNDNDTSIQAELESLKSHSLLEKTYKSLIKDIPNTQSTHPSTKSTGFKGLSLQTEILSQPLSPQERTLNTIESRLKITRLNQSALVKIQYTHPKQSYAKAFIAQLIDLYTAQQKSMRAQKYSNLNTHLTQQITQMETTIKNLDKQIIALQSNNILKGSNTHNIEKIKSLTQQIESLQQSTFELESIWNNLQSEKGKSLSKQYLNLPQQIHYDRSTLSQLYKDKMNSEIKLFQLLNIYGYKHPKIVKLRAKIEGIKHAITTENNAIKTYIYETIEQQKSLIATLKKQLGTLPKNLNLDHGVSIKMATLIRDKDLQTQLYNETLNDLKQLQKQQINTQDTHIISTPYIMPKPTFNRAFMQYGGLLGFLLALYIMSRPSRSKDTFLSMQHIKTLTHMPCLSLIPAHKFSKKDKIPSAIISDPTSQLAESVRNIKAHLHLQNTNGNAIKTITVASALPEEGKSTLSLWLAKLLAKSGKRVIILDCDLRRPALHTLMQAKHTLSLTDYLTGHCELPDVIHKDNETGLHLIYAQAVPANALDLLTSNTMSNLVSALQETYDFIIFDTPACLAAADAKILSRLSDMTLFVAHWHKTPIVSALNALQALKSTQQNIATVLTRVDLIKHTRYGYGTTIAYYDDL